MLTRFGFCLLLLLFCTTLPTIDGSESKNFFQKVSRTANKVKHQLLEFFYRFRAFFIGHSESTHQSMTNRGCGYAVDDEPMIYNKNSHIRSKIRGGDEALWHTWPWMVALFTNPRQGWDCAGVLVNEKTILTAAHCVWNKDPNEMKAIIGVHTILGKLNPLNYYSIASIHRHPLSENCCKNDLAVIKLSKSVLYGPKINAICLPVHPFLQLDHEEELINRTGVIIGWGDSSKDGLTNMINSLTLKQADVRIFDSKICQESYQNIFDSKTEICAGDYNRRADTMSGDSGGPLLIRETDGRWIVLGITSYGSIDDEQHAPGVYVKLSAYQDWLSTHLKD